MIQQRAKPPTGEINEICRANFISRRIEAAIVNKKERNKVTEESKA